MTDDYYCVLPSLNKEDFKWLDRELVRRNARARFCENPFGSRVYWILKSELHKMPKDEHGPYLGDDEQGYTLSQINYIEDFCIDHRMGLWQPVRSSEVD